MKYADSSLCIGCRRPRGETSLCESCGLDLSTPSLATAWKALESADAWIANARQEQIRPEPSTPLPSFTPPVFNAKSSRSIDAGGVLLVLGALFILVAGGILSAIALGPFALPFMALVAGGLALIADRKFLRASTETLIAIGLILAGLFLSIFTWESASGWMVWSGAALAVSLALLEATKSRNFLIPQVTFGIGSFSGGLSLAIWATDLFPASWDSAAFWAILIATSLVFAIGLLAKKLSHLWAARLSHVSASLLLLLSGAASLLVLIDNGKARSFFGEVAWLPMTVLSIIFIAYSLLNRSKASLRSSTLAVGLILAFLPWWYVTLIAEPKGSIGIALVAALLAISVPASTWAKKGLTHASLVFVALGSVLYLYALLEKADRVKSELLYSSHQTWYESLLPLDSVWWLYLFAAIGVTSYGFLLARRFMASTDLKLAPLYLASLQIPLLSCVLNPNMGTVSASFLISGLLLLGVQRKHTYASATFMVAAVVPALLHAGLTSVLLVLSSASLLVGVRYSSGMLSKLTVLASAALLFFVPLGASVQLNSTSESTGLVLVIFTTVLLLSSLALRKGGAELTELWDWTLVFLLSLTLLSLTFEVSAGWMSLLAFVVASSLGLISILDAQRPAFRYVSFVFLLVSWWARLSASDVSTLEAYTLPVGVVLLAAGMYRMSKTAASSWLVLTSGLTASLLPSLFLVLLDPVSPRALILGAAAIALLAWGLAQSLGSVLVFSSGTLAAIALIELGPYVAAMERWIPLVIVGAILAFAGATWEARVKDGRAIARYLSTLK